MSFSYESAIMNLFKCAIEKDKVDSTIPCTDLIKRGIVFINQEGNLITHVEADSANLAIELWGYNNDIWSNSFHKSWEKVSSTPIEELVAEQLIHYFSTYGLEMLGMEAIPYIPFEKVLTDPETVPNDKGITIIKMISVEDTIELTDDYFRKTIAPHRNNINDIETLVKYTMLKPEEIKSFEIRIMRYDYLGIVPTNGQDFLRFLNYKITGTTTLVKDKETINRFKASSNHIDIRDYLSKANLIELAKVFYRFKPLFLALKNENTAPTINKIRRLAVKYHQPCSDVTIANVSKLIREHKYSDFHKLLEEADVRTLIKLLNFANMRKTSEGAQIYNIRNGKVFINTEVSPNLGSNYYFLYETCVRQLQALLCDKFKGKTFYIPSYIEYAVPISEKQFIGNIPYGTTVTTEANENKLTAAIHWHNFEYNRTDLDLHMNSATEHFGWNGNYRGDDVLFSGDMTDAKDGAVEAFNFTPNEDNMYILSVSNFTYQPGVPFDFFMTETGFTNKLSNKYCRMSTGVGAVCDVADAIFPPIHLKFHNGNSQSIGYFEGNTFTFYGGDLGQSIVPKKDLYADALDAIKNRCATMFLISDLIGMGSGCVVRNSESLEQDKDIIDLSPNALTERTLLDLID